MVETSRVMPEAVEVVMPGPVEPEGLLVRRRRLRPPGAGQALVHVEATGVSFAEQQMRRGKYYDQPPFPFVPGYDLVGTVVEEGEQVSGLALGERVAALTKVGAWTTDLVIDAADLVPVPPELDPVAVETVIVNGLTAWRMLHRKAAVTSGQTIVVLGAAGGVGSTLVQLAKLAGVRVIGTASTSQTEAVRGLGAEPVDRREPDLAEAVRRLAPRGVDAVFDHVGGDGIDASWRMLGPGGILISYGTAATRDLPGDPAAPVLALIRRLEEYARQPGDRRATFFNLWEGVEDRVRFRAELRQDLGEVLGLLAAGKLRAVVAARLPLERAAEALRLAERGGIVGKVVLETVH